MNLFDIEKVRHKAKELLRDQLSESLSYHSYLHTNWVVESSLTIAAHEGVKNEEDLQILEAAAWLHDVGFIRTYFNHEVESCFIAREILPETGANESEIEKICELIMATKIPQSPKGHLGEILCDADLDYLGRDDFFEWSNKLKQEWTSFDLIKNDEDFFEKQLRFLRAHNYHTKDAQSRREPVKQMYLRELSGNDSVKISA